MLRFSILASGSKGNAIYVESQTTSLLLDCGISARQVKQRMEMLGRSADDLDAVVVSHEHRDHVSGLSALCKTRRGSRSLPVYANEGAVAGFEFLQDYTERKQFQTSRSFEVGDISVDSRLVGHDANEPVCLRFRSREARLSVVTDLGELCDGAWELSSETEALVLESNYEDTLLEQGPYPFWLKRRIAGPEGHLSNALARGMIQDLAAEGRLPKVLVAGHLSENCNCPEGVRRSFLEATGAFIEADQAELSSSQGSQRSFEFGSARDGQRHSPRIMVASAKQPTPLVELRSGKCRSYK